VEGVSLLDQIVRDGAQRMLAAALQAEVAAYMEAHTGEVDEHGRRLVVRNGYAESRQLLTSAGTVTVRAPRVDDKRVDGSKELVALSDGYRESTGSWADLLRDCKRRGMRAPVLAVGDGALGFWGALREVFPETCEQRCWFHKIANVLAALPKSAHPAAKKRWPRLGTPSVPTSARPARPSRRRRAGRRRSVALASTRWPIARR